MIKVLVVGMTAMTGGVESVIMNYYRNVDKNACQFDFLSEFDNIAYQEEILNNGSKILKIPSRRKSIFKHKKALNDIFKANKYDAVWVNLCTLSNIASLKVAKKHGVKVRIIHSHNSENMGSKLTLLLHKFNRKLIQKYATDFWACSDLAGKFFYNSKIMNRPKYKVINNAIDVNKFKFDAEIREKYRKELKVEDKFVVGHVGRFHFQKNHKFLIKVFYELQKLKENCELLLIGKGEDEQKIKQQVEDLGIQNKVKFLGIRQDVNNLLMAMDILVFPSVFEGLGLVLIEAQAAGLPCFTSDVVPQTTKVSDNIEYLSLNKDSEEWANTIFNYSYAQERNCDDLIKNLQTKGFDISEQAKNFVELIKSNLKEG